MLKYILFVFVGILIVSCASDAPSNPGGIADGLITNIGTQLAPPKKDTVDAKGGFIFSSDLNWSIYFPAGAVTSPTEITITPITNLAPIGVGDALRCSPSGLVFNSPVTLIRLLPQDFAYEIALEQLAVAYQDERGVWQASNKATYYDVANQIHGEITHFTDWAFVSLAYMDVDKDYVNSGESANASFRVQPSAGSIRQATPTNRVPLKSPIGPSNVDWSLITDSCGFAGGVLTSTGADANIQVVHDTCDHALVLHVQHNLEGEVVELQRSIPVGGYIEFTIDGKYTKITTTAFATTLGALGTTSVGGVTTTGESRAISIGWIGTSAGEFTHDATNIEAEITLGELHYKDTYFECDPVIVNTKVFISVTEANRTSRFIRGTFTGKLAIARGPLPCPPGPNGIDWEEVNLNGSFLLIWNLL